MSFVWYIAGYQFPRGPYSEGFIYFLRPKATCISYPVIFRLRISQFSIINWGRHGGHIFWIEYRCLVNHASLSQFYSFVPRDKKHSIPLKYKFCTVINSDKAVTWLSWQRFAKSFVFFFLFICSRQEQNKTVQYNTKNTYHTARQNIGE